MMWKRAHLLRKISAVLQTGQWQIPVLQEYIFFFSLGRWWIVGSAWSEREEKDSSELDVLERTENTCIIEFARQQRMNTDIRRNIFCIVMTSEVIYEQFFSFL